MEYEKQLKAMKAVMEALAPLEERDRKAVMDWVNGQLGVVSRDATPQTKSSAPPGIRREGTVNVVAQKLGVSSARDLLLASATYLTLYQDKETFSKDELVACAKEARAWKAAYANQMALNITRMANAGILFDKAKDIYSLSDQALADVQERLS